VSDKESPIDRYDLVIFDLDGVVYLGHEPIDGAVDAINGLLSADHAVAYATNNASRRAEQVVELLTSLGIHAHADEVITAAQASAVVLAGRLEPGARVLIVGGPALRQEVADVGLVPVASADEKPSAVVQGYAPDVGWKQLAEACLAIRAGALWVATNADRTLPSPRGELPGNGSLVAALATALDRQPDLIVGKPAPTLFDRAARKIGATKPLVVGDRLDTDIAGAVQAGMDSMLVLTGVDGPADLLTAVSGTRPDWVTTDLRGLTGGAVVVPNADSDGATAADGWSVRRSGAGLELDGSGPAIAALAALAGASWARDASTAADLPAITAVSDAATAALRELKLV
jgi:glycerol-1-phosphatase